MYPSESGPKLSTSTFPVYESWYRPNALSTCNRYAPLVTLDLEHEIIIPVPDVDQVSCKGKIPIRKGKGKKLTKDKNCKNHIANSQFGSYC